MSEISLGQVHALLAARRYTVTEIGGEGLQIQEPDSGVTVRAVLEGEILFFSVVCAIVPAAAVTPAVMRKMLDAANGISTSHFQIHDVGGGKLAISLENFCKLQELGADDEDDVLSCVGFLLADVVQAKSLIGSDLQGR